MWNSFDTRNVGGVLQQILRDELLFPQANLLNPPGWADADEPRAFIAGLMQFIPGWRRNVVQALGDPWIVGPPAPPAGGPPAGGGGDGNVAPAWGGGLGMDLLEDL